jgi:hypothetical protein
MFSSIEYARIKLHRVAVHIKAIGECVADYSGSEPHKRVTQADGKQKVNVIDDPPPEISVLAGEALYQLRSAIDHLAFDLVKLNAGNIQLPADWEEHCFFPLWLNVPKKPATYNCFSHILPGISKQAFTFIEGVQPYRSNRTGNVLRLLADLSNIDKHRYLNLTKARLANRERIETSQGRYTSIRRIEDGAELDPVPTTWVDGKEPVYVERSISVDVSFAEPKLGGITTYQVPIQEVLQLVLDEIETIVIPAFDQFLNNP